MKETKITVYEVTKEEVCQADRKQQFLGYNTFTKKMFIVNGGSSNRSYGEHIKFFIL